MADFDPVSYIMGAKAGSGGGGGSSTLAGLTDVDISNPSDGQTLVYDAAAEKWVNGESGGSGGVVVCHIGETLALDKTYREIVNADMAVIKDTVEGITTLYYLCNYDDLPSDANSEWEGMLGFIAIDSPIPQGSVTLPIRSFSTTDPDEYPVQFYT